ncbi:uncharacterized protein BT62DRAFT_1005892 [Guyanagaster necrorhizus]|uniref:Uncharacterized protein n=1 Tax=Guyanagaster necrorhizus TaxID=856835 RepID=A0A9P7VTV0_9AGAR|nr:uncharacterized protein BT62DRAFT_1005892 [Guyanagaster necrorhizus MCA 3950]KAG7446605.1 hypothetical protein BT62DRAFT_1005892 [Guyanagaster necrorhizus MCA 3950]
MSSSRYFPSKVRIYATFDTGCYVSLLSCIMHLISLEDATAVPCRFLSWRYVHPRFQDSQALGSLTESSHAKSTRRVRYVALRILALEILSGNRPAEQDKNPEA